MVCLPKLGPLQGMKLFLTGERFSGTQAVTLGPAHRAVPAAGLMAAAQEELRALHAGGPVALAEIKTESGIESEPEHPETQR